MNNNINLIVLCVALLGASFFLGRCSTAPDKLAEYDKKFKLYNDSVIVPTMKRDSELTIIANKLTKSADSIKKISDSKTIQINKIQSSISILDKNNKHLIDSLSKSAPVECQSIIKTVDSALTNEIDSLKTKSKLDDERHVADSTAYNLLFNTNLIKGQQNDSLRAVIRNIPVPPKSSNTFLGIPKPSGPVSFLLGAVTVGIIEELPKILKK